MYKLPLEKSRKLGSLNKKGKKTKLPTETREELRMELDDLAYGISDLNKQLNQVDPGTPESNQIAAELNSYEKRYNKIKAKLK